MAKSRGVARKAAVRRVLADTMTSAEMAAHRRKNGILLLPVGCFEMHDVHVGMSCDTFTVEATCRWSSTKPQCLASPPASPLQLR
jgi:creatinine amidohydrolase/Fe(II)-dependent formamide hydrolase-like protein